MGALLEMAKLALREADGRSLPDRAASDPGATPRKAMALAYLDANPGVLRACFYHAPKGAPFVILTVAVRDPRAALEMSVSRDKFDAMKLYELSLNYPGTSVFVPEH